VAKSQVWVSEVIGQFKSIELRSMPTPHAKVRSKALYVVLNTLVAAKVTWNIPDGNAEISIGSVESSSDTSSDGSVDRNKVCPF
jgi:hypothetical protein